ncbi:transglutaminase TgpA family protein [Halorientalis pallida]|nr:transglutaminaseTgpA domain-containing protein [Halorientalis pallida]
MRTPGSGSGGSGGGQSGPGEPTRNSPGSGAGSGSGPGPGSEPGPGSGGNPCPYAVQTPGQDQQQDTPVQPTPVRDRDIGAPTTEPPESDRCRNAPNPNSRTPSPSESENNGTAGTSTGSGSAGRSEPSNSTQGSGGAGSNPSDHGQSGQSDGGGTRSSESASGGSGQQSGQSTSRSQQSVIGPSRGNRTSLGGPVSRSNPQIQFVVDADTAAYWRTMAYDQYTGTGWQRTVDDRPSVPEPSMAGDRFIHEITAKQPLPAQTLPTAWRPQRLIDGEEYGRVTDDGRLVSTQTVGANESYTVSSQLPPSSAATLQQADGTAPPALAQHYTELPSNVPDRVGLLTGSLTSDADTRYETAAQIERWLEANKNYSLNARDAPSNFVDTFLFDMDRGYCQYFAAAMVVMLRTQDVPARYVTGYSPGQKTDDGTVVVRKMNAHAWVEVYVPGEGWVQFDPTPPSPRTNLEGQALNGARAQGVAGVDTPASQGESYAPPSQGSPAKSGSPGSQSGSGGPGQTDKQGSGGGQQRQQSEGSGQQGQSGSRGQRRQTGSGQQNQQGGQSQQGQSGSSGGEDSGSEGQEGTQGSSSEEGSDQSQQREESEDTDSTEDTSTPAYNISVDGEAISGRNITVTVTRSGSPQNGVTVLFNNESVGETDTNGQLSARVPFQEELLIEVQPPADDSSSVRSPAQRGAAGFAGSSTLSIGFASGTAVIPDGPFVSKRPQQSDDGSNRTVRLDVDTGLRVVAPETPTPGQSVPVRTMIEQFPVTEAAVSVNGQFVGLTNESGYVIVDIPYAEQLNITAERGEARATTTVTPEVLAISVTGERTPGKSLRVKPTVGNATVPNATVRLDGKRVGETNASGNATFTVPFRPDIVVGVSRGELAVNRTIDLPDELTVTTSGLAVPGLSVTTTVTINGEPVPNATVRGNGGVLGTTASSGVLDVSLPFQNSYKLTVSRGELRGSTTVSWILLLPVLGVLGLLALAGVTLSDRYLDVGPSPIGLMARVHQVTASALQRLVSSVVGAIAYVVGLLERLEAYCRRLLSDTLATLRATPGRIASWFDRQHHRIQAWFQTQWASLRSALTRYYVSVRETDPRALVGILAAAIWRRVKSVQRVATSRDTEATQGTAVTTSEDDGRIDIQQAWRELTARVQVSNPQATTPVQYGERAIDRGFPADAVETLTELYRKAEYSYWDPTTADERQARDALQRIRRELDHDRSQGGTADD